MVNSRPAVLVQRQSDDCRHLFESYRRDDLERLVRVCRHARESGKTCEVYATVAALADSEGRGRPGRTYSQRMRDRKARRALEEALEPLLFESDPGELRLSRLPKQTRELPDDPIDLALDAAKARHFVATTHVLEQVFWFADPVERRRVAGEEIPLAEQNTEARRLIFGTTRLVIDGERVFTHPMERAAPRSWRRFQQAGLDANWFDAESVVQAARFFAELPDAEPPELESFRQLQLASLGPDPDEEMVEQVRHMSRGRAMFEYAAVLLDLRKVIDALARLHGYAAQQGLEVLWTPISLSE